VGGKAAAAPGELRAEVLVCQEAGPRPDEDLARRAIILAVRIESNP
jgi:hypothetical protein